MLERVVSDTGVVFYRSPLLAAAGVPHAFSTRVGGISPPPFDSLNLGNPNGCAVQDDVARIAENYRLLQGACGLAGRRWCRVHQVHAADVVWVDSVDSYVPDQKADVLLTRDSGAAISVRVADCVPILIATTSGDTVGAVHAGWRGVVTNAIGAAIRAIRERDKRRQPIIAAIGPCISSAAFEVGPEVADEFTRVFGSMAPIHQPSAGAKPHIDLREAVRLQLLSLDVKPDQIDTTDRCTVRHVDEFFSHRRDNGVTGRMAAMIGTGNNAER